MLCRLALREAGRSRNWSTACRRIRTRLVGHEIDLFHRDGRAGLLGLWFFSRKPGTRGTASTSNPVSNIEWTDQTWNPVTGCTKVSEGCNAILLRRDASAADLQGAAAFTDVRVHEERFDQPLHWRKPRARVRQQHVDDLFHEAVSHEDLDRIFARWSCRKAAGISSRCSRRAPAGENARLRLARGGRSRMSGWASLSRIRRPRTRASRSCSSNAGRAAVRVRRAVAFAGRTLPNLDRVRRLRLGRDEHGRHRNQALRHLPCRHRPDSRLGHRRRGERAEGAAVLDSGREEHRRRMRGGRRAGIREAARGSPGIDPAAGEQHLTNRRRWC